MTIQFGAGEDQSRVRPLGFYADEMSSGRKGRMMHVSTLYSHARVGRNGQRLAAISNGRVLCTTWAAINEYFSAITNTGDNPCGEPANAPSATRSPAARRKALDKAEADLKLLGL